jgi:hypothetical protein
VSGPSDDVRLVTIRGGGRRLELPLPAAAPVVELTELLPALPALRAGGDLPPPARTLARVGGTAMPRAMTLTEADAVDGEVLYVVDPTRWRAPRVSDLAPGEGPGGASRWMPEAAATLLGGLAVLGALVAAVAAARSGAVRDSAAALVLVAAAGLLAGAIGLRPRPGLALVGPARTALALCGWIAAGLGAWGVAGPGTPAALATGARAVAAAALTTAPVALAPSPGAALAGSVLAGASVAVAAGVPPASAAAVVLALGLLLLRLLTPACGWLLGASTAGLDPERDRAALAGRTRRLRTAMASASCGLVAVVLGTVPTLLAGTVPTLLAGGVPEQALVVVAALALLLRAGSYRFLADVLPPAAAAAVALLAVEAVAGLRLAADPALVVAALAGTALVLAGVSAVWTALPPLARPSRAGWVLVDLLLLPLVLASLGVFGAVAQLVRHLLP